MRGVAAICVMIYHYTRFYMPQAGGSVIPVAVEDVPYASVFSLLYLHGEDFVRMFWVISGFVFAHVYWARETTVREFALARFVRLYPLHFMTLCLVAVLQTISMSWTGHWQIVENNDLRHFVLQLFLIGSSVNFSDGNSFNAPIWSVSAEILVYVFFLITLSFSRRFTLNASILLMIASYLTLITRPENFIITDWVFICSVFFFAGCTCYALYMKFARNMAAIGVIVVGLLGVTVVDRGAGLTDVTLVSLCCATVVALAFIQRWDWAGGPILKLLGDLSYSLYLVHIPLQICMLLIADIAFGGTRAFADCALTLPIYVFASLALAYFTHTKIELPLGRWLKIKLR